MAGDGADVELETDFADIVDHRDYRRELKSTELSENVLCVGNLLLFLCRRDA